VKEKLLKGFIGNNQSGGFGLPSITKGKKMEKETTLGNKLKFRLEYMFMLLAARRDKEAAEIYNQLIAEFDKLK
jgi:hypothetical protein